MRILIVEDDPTLADGLTRSLQRADYAVDCIHDGEQAGLGLAIVHEIAQSHNAKTHLEPGAGGTGTRVTVAFPRAA